MNLKAACVFIVIMEVSISQQQLMATAAFEDEKCQHHLEFPEREKPVDLSSAAWQPLLPRPIHNQTDLLSFSLLPVVLVCSLVCVGMHGLWCLKDFSSCFTS